MLRSGRVGVLRQHSGWQWYTYVKQRNVRLWNGKDSDGSCSDVERRCRGNFRRLLAVTIPRVWS